MASAKLTYTAEQTMTVTGLASLGNSPTAGWSSDYVDNTTNLYLDAEVQIVLDPANTAPANDKCFYLFAWGSNSGSNLPTTGAASGNVVGTEGALTFPTIADRQQLTYTIIPYIAQDVVVKASNVSICELLGLSTLPAFWGVAILNYSGAALAASGHSVKWRGKYLTTA